MAVGLPDEAASARASRLALWGPVVLWAAVIFALSSIPGLATGLGTWDLVLRKLAHAGEFALLGALLARAIRGSPWVAVALGSVYAVTDEVHQTFVAGRQGSPLDWAIDTAGVLVGVALFARASR
jgi:VanZ like protein